MKTFIKKLAMLLVIVLCTESAAADTTISNENDYKVDESSTFDPEHSEIAVETTTDETGIIDEVTTPSGIIVDIMELIREYKKGLVSDGVVSPSAVDYEVDSSNIPDEVRSLIRKDYRELNETEKFLLNRYVFVRDDTMSVCGNKGLNIEHSIPYALIMQTLDIDFESARAMVISWESESKAVKAAYKYGNLFYEQGKLINDDIKSEFKEYAVVGYSAEEVFNAYIFSMLIGKEFSETINDKKNGDGVTNAVKAEYRDIVEKYCVREYAVQLYTELGFSTEDVDIVIKSMINSLKENKISTFSVGDDTFDVGYDASFKEGALSYIKGIGDSIDPCTGAVAYSQNICKLPGLNGLDLDLTITYTSNTTNMAKEIDRRVNIASNWSFNIPYLSSKELNGDFENNDPQYITLENGATYELMTDGNDFVPKNCITDKLVLKKDINKKGGSSSAFYLIHKNGDINYFNIRGRWIKTENRFGNSIKVVGETSSDTRMVIEDTVGRRIIVSELTTDSNTIVQSITMPNNITTKITYKQNQYGGHKKIELINIIDSEGNNTAFKYNICEKDNYKNALVTEITAPTGLKNYYEYIWDNKPDILIIQDEDTQRVELNDFGSIKDKIGTYINDPKDYWRIDYQRGEYQYASISKRYSVDTDNKKTRVVTYMYNGSYTYSEAYYNVFCGCLKWSCRLCSEKNEDGDFETFYEFFAARDCNCIYYYDGKKWLCKGNECIGNIVIKDDPYTFTTTVSEENGLKTIYTFNQRSQNTSTDIYEGDTLIQKNMVDYYLSNTKSNIPQKITDIKYQGGLEKNRTVQDFEYTELFDVKKNIVKQGATELKNVSYEYDYNGLDTSTKTAGLDYYGMCTKTTTKMNGNTNVVEENKLENSGLYVNKAIKETTVKRNGVLESKAEYGRESYDSGRVSHIRYYTSDNSYIFVSYDYTDYNAPDSGRNNQAGPTSVTISDNNGKRYETYCKYDANERITDLFKLADGISIGYAGYLTKYSYNNIGDITGVTYFKEPVTNIDSNTSGIETAVVSLAYNYAENKITVTNENGNSEIYNYDSFGNPTSVTKGGQVLSTYTYDSRLRPLTYKEGKAVTSYTYDNRDRLLSEIVKEGTKVLSNKSYTYEDNTTGLKVTEKINGDSSSAAITNITQADVLGRNTMINKAGNITYYTYDMLDNAIKEQNHIVTLSDRTVYLTMDYIYDSKGNILSAIRTDDTDTANAKKTYASYDMLGRMITSTDGMGNTTEYTYNGLDQILKKKVPFYIDNSGKMNYTEYIYNYDAAGNLESEHVTSGTTSKYEYDYRGNVIHTETGDQSADYVYDNVGNMIQYSTAGGTQVHKYDYDVLNRITKYTDALGNSESYTYDSNMDMIKKTDRNGKNITYTYDGLHRMLTEKAEGAENSWTYGLTGGVLSETNSNAVKTYTYNDKGLVESETAKIGSDAFKISRIYDSRGNDREDSYYKNGTLYQKYKYVYDNKNRIDSVYDVNVSSNAESQKVKYYYDYNDNVKSVYYGNNTYNTYSYNAANLITGMDLIRKSDSSKLEHLVYNYRLDGNMLNKTESYNSCNTETTYSYDDAGRLSKEDVKSDGENFNIAYTYDTAGNRSSMKLSGYSGNYTENYSYDKNNKLLSSVKDYGTTSAYTNYTYDKNGNQTKVEKYSKNNDGRFKLDIVNTVYGIENAGVEKFTYNSLNQLIGYENINGNYNGKVGLNAEYKYMANGYRLSKNVNGIETRYLWDRDNIAAELNSVNVVSQKYCRGYNLICDDSNVYYAHDAHGNVIEKYNSDGSYSDDWYIYNAFGTNKYFNDTCTPNKWGYCDQLKDWETGNYYMRARYYNPDTGRFISEDPIRDGSNWYSYCYNNPLIFRDKNGLFGENTVLKRGANNNMNDVIKLQQFLSKNGFLNENYTYGVYDKYTEDAVNLYKTQNNLYNVGKYNGVVEKTMWEYMGLEIDSIYEISHSVVGNNGVSSDGLFASLSGPNLDNGINLITARAGLTQINKDTKYYELDMQLCTTTANVGINKDYIGYDLSATLLEAGASIKIPLPFTDSKLIITGTGYVGSVGIGFNYDNKNKTISVNASAIVGSGISIGIGN